MSAFVYDSWNSGAHTAWIKTPIGDVRVRDGALSVDAGGPCYDVPPSEVAALHDALDDIRRGTALDNSVAKGHLRWGRGHKRGTVMLTTMASRCAHIDVRDVEALIRVLDLEIREFEGFPGVDVWRDRGPGALARSSAAVRWGTLGSRIEIYDTGFQVTLRGNPITPMIAPDKWQGLTPTDKNKQYIGTNSGRGISVIRGSASFTEIREIHPDGSYGALVCEIPTFLLQYVDDFARELWGLLTEPTKTTVENVPAPKSAKCRRCNDIGGVRTEMGFSIRCPDCTDVLEVPR